MTRCHWCGWRLGPPAWRCACWGTTPLPEPEIAARPRRLLVALVELQANLDELAARVNRLTARDGIGCDCDECEQTRADCEDFEGHLQEDRRRHGGDRGT